MTKLDMLWFRACKSKNPQKRLQSVYRRFYLCGEADPCDLANILCGLVEKYLHLPLYSIIDGLNPDHPVYRGHTHFERLVLMLTSKLRLSNMTPFKGYIAPMRFR